MKLRSGLNVFNNKVVVITGPTAIGKTDLSLKLCEIFNGEIINADASQFKKELNIGTAKIDLTSTSIKHHLIDIIGPLENFSVYDYQKEGRILIDEIIKKEKTPFVIGGSGLYINALMYDYKFDSSGRDDSKFDQYSNQELFEMLEKVDLNASLNIPVNNRKRLVRALELAQNGNKISENICDNVSIYPAIFICLTTDRDILYQRINKRVDIMIENGWLEECIELKNKGYDLDKITDIGYKELNDYLENKITLNEALDLIKQRTRHLAKRQMTWFRNKMNCIFVNVSYDNPSNTLEEIVKIIKEN